MHVSGLIVFPNLEHVTGLYFNDQNKWIIANVSLCCYYNINNYYKYFLTLLSISQIESSIVYTSVSKTFSAQRPVSFNIGS